MRRSAFSTKKAQYLGVWTCRPCMRQRIFLPCSVTCWAMLIQTLMETRPEQSYTQSWHAALCASNTALWCTGCHSPSLPPLTLEKWPADSLCPSAIQLFNLKHDRHFQIQSPAPQCKAWAKTVRARVRSPAHMKAPHPATGTGCQAQRETRTSSRSRALIDAQGRGRSSEAARATYPAEQARRPASARPDLNVPGPDPRRLAGSRSWAEQAQSHPSCCARRGRGQGRRSHAAAGRAPRT